MLKHRIISIVIFAPVFIASVLLMPTNVFKLLLSLLLLISAFEWAKLSGVSGLFPGLVYAFVLVLVAHLGDLFAGPIYLEKWLYWLSVFWWAFVLLWIITSQMQSKIGTISRRFKLVMGLITLLPVWYALAGLHASGDRGPEFTLYLILLVWCADIGAYVTGRLFGRRKLASVLSPGKTIEGVLGGVFFVMILALATAVYFEMKILQIWLFILISIAVALISVVGDLYESILKRQAGVKDSGRLLPGHGGALDRIDSLTAAAPVFYIGFICFLKQGIV